MQPGLVLRTIYEGVKPHRDHIAEAWLTLHDEALTLVITQRDLIFDSKLAQAMATLEEHLIQSFPGSGLTTLVIPPSMPESPSFISHRLRLKLDL